MKLVYRVEQGIFYGYLEDFSKKKHLEKLGVESLLLVLDLSMLDFDMVRVTFGFKTDEHKDFINPDKLIFPGVEILFPLIPELQVDIHLDFLLGYLRSRSFLLLDAEEFRSLRDQLRDPRTRTTRLEFWCHHNESSISWRNEKMRLTLE